MAFVNVPRILLVLKPDMTSDLAVLMGTLSLGAEEKQKKVDTALSKFDTLSESEKESERANTLAEIFPLVFGEKAALKSSANYEELRQTPW